MLNPFYCPEPPLEPPDYKLPVCPICWEESDTFFIDKFGAVVGCGECVSSQSSIDFEESKGGEI